MDTGRWCLLGLLAFLSTDVFAVGVISALNRDIPLFPSPRKGNGCRANWIKHRRQCYNINRAARVSRRDAHVACRAKGKDVQLADIKVKDTRDFLAEQTQDGGYDSLWVANPDMDTDSGGGCSSIVKSTEDCSDKKGYVCEELNKYEGCPKGYVGQGEWCYTMTSFMTSWGIARMLCRSLDPFGDLASVNSREEYDFIQNEFGGLGDTRVWIGLRKLSPSTPYTWTNGERVEYLPWGPDYTGEESRGYGTMGLKDVEFMLTENYYDHHHFLCSTPRVTDERDTTQTSLSNAQQVARESTMDQSKHSKDVNKQGEIMDIEERKEYMDRAVKRLVMDTRNFEEASDIEEVTNGEAKNHIGVNALNSVDAVAGISKTCEGGWQAFGDYCYKVFRRKKTFNGASSGCQSRGAQLVSLYSTQESEFLQTHVMAKSPKGSYWIGLSRDEIGLLWSDDSAVDYTFSPLPTHAMVPEKPLAARRNENIQSPLVQECFGMDWLKGLVTRMDCGTKLSYICQKSQVEELRNKNRNSPSLSDPGHAANTKVCPGTQSCGPPRQTDPYTDTYPKNEAVIFAVLLFTVILAILAFCVLSWYTQYGHLPPCWSWLQGHRRSRTFDAVPLQRIDHCRTPSEPDKDTVDGNQSNVYGTIS